MNAPLLRTDLKKARGLGTAHSGVGHWLALRICAVALVPLTFWLVFAMLHLANADYSQVILWIRQPVNAILLLALILFAFYHGYLGLQEVIEDYVHRISSKFFLLIALRIFFFAFAVADIFAVFFINFRL